MTLRGSVLKRSWGQWGGWRRNGWKAKRMKQRDLPGTNRRSSSESVDAKNRRAGVRAFIVATKRGNARGAKGRRKMDSQDP
jgi:hypothetical protein